jgi:hypothetical protein
MDWDEVFLHERGYPARQRHPVTEEGREVSRERGKERDNEDDGGLETRGFWQLLKWWVEDEWIFATA